MENVKDFIDRVIAEGEASPDMTPEEATALLVERVAERDQEVAAHVAELEEQLARAQLVGGALGGALVDLSGQGRGDYAEVARVVVMVNDLVRTTHAELVKNRKEVHDHATALDTARCTLGLVTELCARVAWDDESTPLTREDEARIERAHERVMQFSREGVAIARRDADWTAAIAMALGPSSGYTVPLRPSANDLRALFDAVRASAQAETNYNVLRQQDEALRATASKALQRIVGRLPGGRVAQWRQEISRAVDEPQAERAANRTFDEARANDALARECDREIAGLKAEVERLKVRDSNLTFHDRNVMAVNEALREELAEQKRLLSFMTAKIHALVATGDAMAEILDMPREARTESGMSVVNWRRAKSRG